MTGIETDKTNVSQNEEIGLQAIDWIERSDREDWSVSDQADLDAWMNASTAHKVAYLRAQDGWRRADRLVALRGTFGPQSPVDARQNWAFQHKVAAGTIVAVALAALWLGLPGSRSNPESYSTQVGGHKLVTLADGTQIELNTDTRLRAQFDAHRRTVWIDRGEAYFQVTHNPQQPLTVWADGSRIRDLGTKFVVRAKPDEMRVALVEGRAEVDVPAKPQISRVVLVPGDVAIATANAMSVVKRTRQSVEESLAWRRGVLVLDHTTLAEAAAQMNRYNERKIIIADAEAGSRPIEGTFPANNVDLFGRVAQSVLGLHVETKGRDLVISH